MADILKGMATWKCLAATVVSFSIALGLHAQDPTSQPGTISTHSTLVVVPALVKTKAGAVVYTLKAEDFTLTDNGVEQKLSLDENAGSQPLALIVLVETGGAGGRQLDLYRTLPTMLDAIVGGESHKVAVVSFDSAPHFMQKFTPDIDRVANALNTLDEGDGKAAILDALVYSTNILRRQPPQFRRAILLVSETLDHGSKGSLGEALRAVSDSNTVIYSVAFSSTRADARHEGSKIIQSDTPGPPGGCMAKDPNADPNITENEFAKAFECLQVLIPPIRIAKIAALAGLHGLQKDIPKTVAGLTGGEFFKFNNTKSLERDLQAISNHVPNRYVLSFQPQSPTPGIHALELHLKDYPDLVVTARSSYWAENDPATPARPPAPGK